MSSTFQSSTKKSDSFLLSRKRKIVAGFVIAFTLFSLLFMGFQPGEARDVPPVAASFAAPGGMFFVGEELVYEVSYSVFSLGTVRLQILDTMSKDGVTLYQTKAFMDSYSGVPFVSLHYVFYSEIDPEYFSHYFSGLDTKNADATSYADYGFDYKNNVVHTKRGIRQKPEKDIAVDDTISTTYQDGLSLFYYARGRIHSTRTENVPTYVSEKKVNTHINFINKSTTSEIDAVKYPIDTIEFDGRADFVGIFGLTGGFTGWFSNDEAAIPIVAKMKVILGSIRVELIRWNRPGWTPPRAS